MMTSNKIAIKYLLLALLIGAVSLLAVENPTQPIANVRSLLADQSLSPAQCATQILNILKLSGSQPLEYNVGMNDGSITKTNSLPLLIATIASPRDNPRIEYWSDILQTQYKQLPKGQLRQSLAIILGLMGEPVRYDDLKLTIQRSNDDVMRGLAVSALGNCGDPSVVPDLRAVLNSNSTPMVSIEEKQIQYYFPLKRSARRALANFGYSLPKDVELATPKEVVKYLSDVLLDNSGGTIAAAVSLRAIGNEQAEAALEAYVSKFGSQGAGGKSDVVNEQLKLLREKSQRKNGEREETQSGPAQ